MILIIINIIINSHLSDNRGTVRISDSVLSGQGDDGANINSRYSDVEHIHFDSNSITFGKVSKGLLFNSI